MSGQWNEDSTLTELTIRDFLTSYLSGKRVIIVTPVAKVETLTGIMMFITDKYFPGKEDKFSEIKVIMYDPDNDNFADTAKKIFQEIRETKPEMIFEYEVSGDYRDVIKRARNIE